MTTKASNADCVHLVQVYPGESDTCVYLVARESGLVELYSITSAKPSHSFMRLTLVDSPALFEPVVSMAWFPYHPSFFMCAYEGGMVAVYSVKASSGSIQVPVWQCDLNLHLGLQNKDHVQFAVWSDVRPAVFYVLTSRHITVFDLSLDTAGPVEVAALPKDLDATSMTLVDEERRGQDQQNGQKLCIAGQKGVYWWTIPDEYLDRRGEGDEKNYLKELLCVYES